MHTHCQTEINVVVHYAAAEHPLKRKELSEETVGQVKNQVLRAFGLTEGEARDGSVVTYTLYHERTPLENPSQTLGEVAHHRHELQLKLVQQITQG